MEKQRCHTEHTADICVIGGGLAGLCAAISAARHGSSVILIHDRPVLGGNCSSEIRMWPLGAHGDNRRETGIFEELVLENMHINPTRNYPLWDAVLYGAVRRQTGLTGLLNCSVYDADTENDRITAVYGWQLTTYQRHKVTARVFIDCSGDSVLAEFTGAAYRVGREARAEFGEAAAPEEADRKTMGNSCLIQARETGAPVPFTPPAFAAVFPDDTSLHERPHAPALLRENYWWLELGGEQDSLKDCETVKDELLSLSYGVWDHVKNKGDHGAANWELDFAAYLPGKRESRRYVGGHLLTQNEVEAGGRFADIIAYGGWTIDDHPPAGFRHNGAPTRHYPCPSPFGIPYGCLYSANVRNLMFAGRNISVTHAAMAASRVMGTCALLGQAAGTAAALAAERGIDPAAVAAHMPELQRRLMEDDCWLPGHTRTVSNLCRSAVLTADCADAEHLRNGADRPTDEAGDNGCYVPLGSDVTYTLREPAYVERVRLVLDSDLNRTTVTGGIPETRDCPTICNRPLNMPPYTFPATMTADFDILANGEVIAQVRGNHQRLVRVPVERTVKTLTLRPLATCGAETAHVFSFDF